MEIHHLYTIILLRRHSLILHRMIKHSWWRPRGMRMFEVDCGIPPEGEGQEMAHRGSSCTEGAPCCFYE